MCALAEQSWALKAVLGLKEFVCDVASRTQLGFEGRVRNAVLGLKELVYVPYLAKQRWALKAGLVRNAVLGLKAVS